MSAFFDGRSEKDTVECDCDSDCEVPWEVTKHNRNRFALLQKDIEDGKPVEYTNRKVKEYRVDAIDGTKQGLEVLIISDRVLLEKTLSEGLKNCNADELELCRVMAQLYWNLQGMRLMARELQRLNDANQPFTSKNAERELAVNKSLSALSCAYDSLYEKFKM